MSRNDLTLNCNSWYMVKNSRKPRGFPSMQTVSVYVPVLCKLPVFHTSGTMWDAALPAQRSPLTVERLAFVAAAPGQGGGIRRKRWRRTRTHFQLLLVTPRFWRSEPQGVLVAVRRQRHRQPLCLWVQRDSPHFTGVQPLNQALHGLPGLNVPGGNHPGWKPGVPLSHHHKKLILETQNPAQSSLQHCKPRHGQWQQPKPSQVLQLATAL